MSEHNGTCPYIDITTPNEARIHDYLLGGDAHYCADRMAAEELKVTIPHIAESTLDNRDFLRRVVRHLAATAGIRQFIAVGAGLPTQGNVHAVAQAVTPDARVVYVDDDPTTVTHARALLARKQMVAAVPRDLRHPDAFLHNRELRGLVDLDRPVAMLLVHLPSEEGDPQGIVDRLRTAICPGSYLAIAYPAIGRPVEHFDGLRLIEPGLVDVRAWRPELGITSGSTPAIFIGGVGHKPLPWAMAA